MGEFIYTHLGNYTEVKDLTNIFCILFLTVEDLKKKLSSRIVFVRHIIVMEREPSFQFNNIHFKGRKTPFAL